MVEKTFVFLIAKVVNQEYHQFKDADRKMNTLELIEALYENNTDNIQKIFIFVEDNTNKISNIDDMIIYLDLTRLKGDMRLSILRSCFRIRKQLKNYKMLLHDTKDYLIEHEGEDNFRHRMRGLI